MNRIIFVLFISGLSLLFWFIGKVLSKIVLTMDHSTSYYVFLKESSKKEPEKGDYVIVKGKLGTFSEGKLLTKKVLCTDAEYLKKSGMFYYCCKDVEGKNCEFLHVAVDKTPKGTKLKLFNPCEWANETVTNGTVRWANNDTYSKCLVKIPEGYVYLGTKVPDGYDSRYMGLWDKKEIMCVVKPIF